uniref:Wiskott-Aldrich syndrome-like a n=1 Tax=Nothobranchius pienaari TaxID=704102 RepID=A0A1A8L3J3_9TELE
MNSHPPPRRAVNVGSLLLTPQENECLFGYLGRKCATLSSAVVQVYAAERSYNWVKRGCGVACLVKDNPQRSYFIRVFDIKEGKTMFEQELYHSFIISSSRPYFISFAGDICQIGLNFASEEEAKRFRVAIHDLLNRRQRKTGPPLPMATVDIKNPEINNVRHHSSHSHQQPYHLNNMLSHSSLIRKDKKTKGKKKKLTKADIGTPSNFQHIGHVGWDPNTGFDLNNLDPELKHLFDMCGISEAQLKDRETSKVIYDFIEKKGGLGSTPASTVQGNPGGPSSSPSIQSACICSSSATSIQTSYSGCSSPSSSSSSNRSTTLTCTARAECTRGCQLIGRERLREGGSGRKAREVRRDLTNGANGAGADVNGHVLLDGDAQTVSFPHSHRAQW